MDGDHGRKESESSQVEEEGGGKCAVPKENNVHGKEDTIDLVGLQSERRHKHPWQRAGKGGVRLDTDKEADSLPP